MAYRGLVTVRLKPRYRRKMMRAFAKAALTCVCLSTSLIITPAFSQTADQIIGADTNPNAQLLLQADELIYDNNARTITASGGVRIDYDGTKLVADQVTYIEDSARMVAIGNVEILQPDGTRIFADEIDVTDDFSDGFINALRVVTSDNTRFAAESAERSDGAVTVFNNGIYTACEPCAERPDKAPIWQIKSQRIIWDGNEKTVRFERASFEFFGVPIAYLPVFTTADPTVKRKTGFLAPSFRYSDQLGFSAAVPYFWALAPNYDVKLTTTGYTNQGFLAEAEFRHRLENGIYNLKIAGIHQLSPDAFSGAVDKSVETRAMVGTKGDFAINPRWSFGWNALLQTDKRFSKTYGIEGFTGTVQRNEIYLTGIEGRNYFDARAMSFEVQESALTGRDEEQPIVVPAIDYEYTFGDRFAGGELSYVVNTRGNWRENTDTRNAFGDANFVTWGLGGTSARATTEISWDREIVTTGGLVITPSVHARGDAHYLDIDTAAPLSSTGATLADNGSVFTGMVTAGLEVRWPILFSASSSTHVLEPIAQVFARPDEMYAGQLPNEDAQSLIFDASNLFARDKFSGFDRTEGGVRANLGVQYTGTFDNGLSVSGTFGQSIHLAGTNSYAVPNTSNVGFDSGLETDRSDYVGAIQVSTQDGLTAAFSARLNEADFDFRRAEVGLNYKSRRFTAQGTYAYLREQDTYGFLEDRHEVTAGGSVRFAENWRVLGSAVYDISDDELDRYSVGMAYDDECFAFQFSYSSKRENDDTMTNQFAVKFTARTLGDLGVSSSDLDF